MKTSYSVAPNATSDATFRAWGKALSDALEAMGFTKTADTGQIDWATAATPGAAAYAGYEIRQFTDALQATVPIIVRIDYGAGATATYPRLQITVGRASSGAGVLVGITSLAMVLTMNYNATASDCYVSCGVGYVSAALHASSGTTSIPTMFYLARPRDANGTVNSKGVNIVGQAGAVFNQQWLPAVGSPVPGSLAMTAPFCAGPKAGTGSYGTTLGVFPIFTYMGYAGHPDGIGIAAFCTDVGAGGQVVSVSMFGVSHDFITGGTTNTGYINGNTTVSTLLVRWE
jgi:hypothetical protein